MKSNRSRLRSPFPPNGNLIEMKRIWLLCVSAALAVFSSAEDQCPKKVYSPLSRLLAPGSAVTLHCGGDASLPGLSPPAEWSLNGRPLRSNPQRTVSEDSVLITAARINDAGNYTCHRGGQIISTMNITVGVAPEKPVLSCYRKVPTQNVRCEWSATNRPIPAPSCKLLVRKRLIGQSSQYNCTFSSTKQRCSCVLPHVEGDTVLYLVSLCVSNSAGAQKSEDQTFTGDSIIKPDPPINVQVHAVMRSSRSLWVNWSKPLSWRTDFYRLRYQVRYRTDQQREYQLLPSRDPRLLISDAGPRRRYEVQVRGQEEFDHGQWSAWSHEAYGHTWAEPELQTQGYQSTHRVHKGVLAGTVGGTVDSLFSQSEGSGLGEEELEVQASSNGSDLLARHTGWVTGVTLLGAAILVSLFIAQYRKKLKAQLLKLGGLAPLFRPPFAKQFSMEVQRSEGGPRTIRKHLEVYVGNIPTAITEIEILQLFAGFEAQNVRKFVAGIKCFAFVDVGSERNVQLAVSQLNSTLYQGRKLRVNTADPDFSDKRSSADKDTPKTQATPTGAGTLVRMEKAAQASDSSAASLAPDPRKPSKDQSAPLSGVTVREDRRRFVYAVPTEMRGCTLVHVLRDCFGELVWLQSITELCGEVGLLLTETHPQTPFFWAIHLSEGAHADMLRLFTALAEQEEESRQPFLTKSDVYRGKRCLAELIQTVGEEGAWNRAWVQDVVGMFAVVFFVDFGTTATIPVMSLRALEDESFWKIPPLAQPFMLEQDILSPRKLIRAVIKGNVTGSCVSEPHIRRLALSPQQD